MSRFQSLGKAKVDAKVWANCPDGMTIPEFVEYLSELGNPIIRVDRDNRRILMATTTPEEG